MYYEMYVVFLNAVYVYLQHSKYCISYQKFSKPQTGKNNKGET